MNWLTYTDLQTIDRRLAASTKVQVVTLFADTHSLSAEIPTQPKLVGPEEGPPTPVHRWLGRIGDRLVEVEADASGSTTASAVVVYTGFLDIQDRLGDWAVLYELQELPRAIYVSRPLYIESRCGEPGCVVYRRDPHGWSSPIYKAISRTEAEQFLEFLSEDSWNKECFLGDPEPLGIWTVFQGEEATQNNTGSDLNWALRTGCETSLRYPTLDICVKDLSGVNKAVYKISNGVVLDSA